MLVGSGTAVTTGVATKPVRQTVIVRPRIDPTRLLRWADETVQYPGCQQISFA
jgi:hypothetical protein